MKDFEVSRVAAFKSAESYTLRIGRETFTVGSLTHASILYQQLRDASGCGSKDWPEGWITVEGRAHRISYNGRVWLGKELVLEAA